MKREHSIESLLPASYTQLEYIESTGTQYIDTGVHISPYLKWLLDVQWLSFNANNCFGAESWQNSSNIVRINNTVSNGVSIVYGDAIPGNYYSYTSNTPTTARKTIILENGHQYIDAVEVMQATMSHSELTYTIHYFCAKVNSTRNYYCNHARHYYSAMWEGKVMVREFFPALRVSDNKPGLYDLVNNNFYVNAGTGEFQFA